MADLPDTFSTLGGKPIERRDMGAIAVEMGYVPHFRWAWDNYKRLILQIAREYDLKRHLEIGGGRYPLLTTEELSSFDFHVTINDISDVELALAAPEFSKIQCDIAGNEALSVLGRDQFDFAYCRMVMEHVPNVRKMWENVYGALAPGGVALSFYPTLYAPPYVINQMLPEKLSRAIVHAVFPERRDDGYEPKFPAYYDYCRSSEDVIVPLVTEIGFSKVSILPFYGNGYFRKIPGLRQLDSAFTHVARVKDWRLFSSFAYIIVTK